MGDLRSCILGSVSRNYYTLMVVTILLLVSRRWPRPYTEERRQVMAFDGWHVRELYIAYNILPVKELPRGTDFNICKFLCRHSIGIRPLFHHKLLVCFFVWLLNDTAVLSDYWCHAGNTMQLWIIIKNNNKAERITRCKKWRNAGNCSQWQFNKSW
jgi:hypothetical protein